MELYHFALITLFPETPFHSLKYYNLLLQICFLLFVISIISLHVTVALTAMIKGESSK